jgi:DNA repair exonuclease SbcCD ATPase subunit
MTVSEISSRLDSVEQLRIIEKNRYNDRIAEISHLSSELQEYKEAIRLCEVSLEHQIDLKAYVEEHITALLQSVFGEAYTFVLEATYKADGVTVSGLRPRVLKYGIGDEPKAYGGGVQNVVSLGWRLVFLLLMPGLEKTLVLDEPWLNLGQRKWVNIIEFISDLQKDVDLQVLVVTHVPAEFPETWRVFLSGRTSTVERLN